AHLVLFRVHLPQDQERTRGLGAGGIGGGTLGGGNIGGGGTIGGPRGSLGGLGGGGLGGGAQVSKTTDPRPRLSWQSSPHGKNIPHEMGKAPVLHAIEVIEMPGTHVPAVLAASNLGVTSHSLIAIAGALIYGSKTLVPGAPGDAPKKGASEIHLG